MPTMPHSAAGMRMEPPPSAPTATGQRPAPTVAAEPLDEPPVTWPGSWGLRAEPWWGLMPVTPRPTSCMLTLPMSRAPASRRRATTVASSFLGFLPRKVVPTVVG